MAQTAFITGASGYIGSVLTTHCLASNLTVRALSRSTTSDEKLRSLGAIPVRGELTSLDVLTREASTADMVFALADSRSANFNISKEERFAINSAAMNALGKGLEGSGKPLIATSGTAPVAPDSQGNETDETSKWAEDAPFGESIESTALAWKGKGVRVCIVRPAPWVYGRGGSGVKLFMMGAMQAGAVMYVGDGTARTTTVHVDDAARLFLLVAQKGRTGEAYNATSETNVTFKQIAEAMGKAVGVPVVSQSYADTEKKMGTFLAKFFSTENRASNKKAREELGWTVEAGKGILDEILTGSYISLVERLRKSKA